MPDEDRNLHILLWTGPIGIATVCLGWMVLAGFLPPPSPRLAGPEQVAMWQDHRALKQFGMIVCLWGGTLYVPFTVGVGLALRRGGYQRVMVNAQTALGTFGTVFFTLPFLVLAVAPFRLEQAPGSTQSLHDLGFVMTFCPVPPFTLQYCAIGLAVLQRRGEGPVGRWVAYANLWVGLLLVPASFIPFFKTGPLAWNGVGSFWVPVVVFVTWFVVMFSAMRRLVAATVPGHPDDAVATTVERVRA